MYVTGLQVLSAASDPASVVAYRTEIPVNTKIALLTSYIMHATAICESAGDSLVLALLITGLSLTDPRSRHGQFPQTLTVTMQPLPASYTSLRKYWKSSNSYAVFEQVYTPLPRMSK